MADFPGAVRVRYAGEAAPWLSLNVQSGDYLTAFGRARWDVVGSREWGSDRGSTYWEQRTVEASQVTVCGSR
jgi:hypothetical protein